MHSELRASEPELTRQEAQQIVALYSSRSSGVDRADGRTLATLHDVAETLDIDIDKARSMLDEIRLLRSVEPKKSKWNWAAIAGWTFAVVAIGYTMTHRPRVLAPAALPKPVVPSPFMSAGIPSDSVIDVSVIPSATTTPPGYDLSVKGSYVRLHAPGLDPGVPMHQDQVRSRLIESAMNLVQQARQLETDKYFASMGSPKPMPYHPSSVELWIGAGNSGQLQTVPIVMATGSTPVDAAKAMRETITTAVDQVLAGFKKIAVEPSITTGGNMAFPPPGFDIQYSGRRNEGLMSGRGALTIPFDHQAAEDKLVAAMRGQMDRDLQPVNGQWRTTAKDEKRLVTPTEGWFTVSTSYGTMRFSVPLRYPGANLPKVLVRVNQDRKLHEAARKLIEEVEQHATQ